MTVGVFHNEYGGMENSTWITLLRRLSAYPFIWWSLANEYDLMFNRTMEDWYEIEEFVAANDCYGHLLSNHNYVHFTISPVPM